MIIISVQTSRWEKPYEISQMRSKQIISQDQFKFGDKVVIKTVAGTDLARVIDIKEKDSIKDEEDNKFIVRKATNKDIKKYQERNKEKKQIINECEKLVKDKKLTMKIIDGYVSLDGGRITFTFTAPHRIDFRSLVKDLATKLHKTIKMYQIGARQEVELIGDIGPCGRPLCCLTFLKSLKKVTTDFIFDQQLSQRGAERLTGMCGRLKCCLAFEEKDYKDLSENMPSLGDKVKTDKIEGKVIRRNILAQTVVVKTKDETEINVPIEKIESLESSIKNNSGENKSESE